LTELPSSNTAGVLLSWSGGKDCGLALAYLRNNEIPIAGLLATLRQDTNTIAQHGIPLPLLRAQAAALMLKLWTVAVPTPCSQETYETIMTGHLSQLKSEGISTIAFGDLFVDEVQQYKEEFYQECGFKPLFPNWDIPKDELLSRIWDTGLKAIVVSVKHGLMNESFVGRVYDEKMLADLPEKVDPLGENGEFHTFVVDGSLFQHPLPYRIIGTQERQGYIYACFES